MNFEKLKHKWSKERELRITESTKRKDRLHDQGENVFKKYGVTKAVIFGSVADGKGGRDSDIDLFVQPLTSEKFWDFRRELENEVGFTIDLYTGQDDPKFVSKILSRGTVVYEL